MVEVFTVNAFTSSISGGNPAGVVLDASSMSESEMQKLAQTLGYSETAFVLPSKRADFRVRFFTPACEVDLCGHATIATFCLLSQLGKIQSGSFTQETLAGVLGIEVAENNEVFMTQTNPIFGTVIDSSVIAGSLNLKAEEFDYTLPPQVVSTGLKDLLVPIRDLQTLTNLKPDFDKVTAVSRQLGVVGFHLFSLETAHGGVAHCRNLAPLYDIPEEAATGTASGALASYLFLHNKITMAQASDLLFEQGYSMSRPSQIKAKLTTEDGVISKVEVGGTACLVESLEY